MLRCRNGKEFIMEEEKTMVTEEKNDIDGLELDMDVEPTAEEIAAAEKSAEEEE